MSLSKKPAPRVILASASPRRRELLQLLGVEFEVRPSAVEERQLPGEPAEVFIARLAREKAEDVARRFAPLPENTVVLGCDTEVVLDGVPLGKPSNDGDAARMLRMLSGRAHEVLTGVCLIPGGEYVESTRVWFREMSESEITEYVASGEPRDKAGAYAIQGRAARFVPRIEGCYYNVMGLPVAALYGLLR
jgi:septum formation protein